MARRVRIDCTCTVPYRTPNGTGYVYADPLEANAPDQTSNCYFCRKELLIPHKKPLRVPTPRKPDGAPRTLTYRDIKRGIHKAGPLPENPSDNVQLWAWLAGAGYGKACLPSLRMWYKLREALKSRDLPRRRYNSSAQLTRAEVEKLTQRYHIVWPGKKRAKAHWTEARSRVRRSYFRQAPSVSLLDRFNTWKKQGGHAVYWFLARHGWSLAHTQCIRVKSIDEGKLSFWFASGERSVGPLVVLAPDGTTNNYAAFNTLFHLQAVALPIP